MKNIQKGFTLIELVVVIVILGILAATAIPAFVDLSAEAEQAATDGVAGALGGAAAINYASCQTTGGTCVTVDDCTDVEDALQGAALPSVDYTITSAAVADDAAVTCTLNGPGAATATFTAIGT